MGRLKENGFSTRIFFMVSYLYQLSLRAAPVIVLAALAAVSCGRSSMEGDASLEEYPDVLEEDVPAPDADSPDAGDGPGEEGAPADDAAEEVAETAADELAVEEDLPDAAEEEEAPWEYVRGSLASCLLDPRCHRVGIESHMGAWTAAIPGNSMAAYRRAWELGADAIEADIRVSRDGVPFMIHDDAITLYESILCAGKVVSESDASEIDGCLLLPSLTETIPSFDEFVTWARGKILIHLDVKESDDVQTMVEQIVAYGAEDFVFIAISGGEAATLLPTIPDADRVYFVMRVGSVAEIDAALTTLRSPNIFMLEGDRTWDTPPVDEAQMRVQVARVQDAGLRIMASSDQYAASIDNHLQIFDMGFDYILSYNTENGIEAARQVNIARGYPP
jgi:glycerophosphoryl diester phosphodiesterase